MPRLLLMLAVLLVFASAALAVIEERVPGMDQALRRRPCPGCYTSLSQRPVEDFSARLTLESQVALHHGKKPSSLEDILRIPSLQPEQERPRSPCVGCFGPLDTSKVLQRARREERRLASARRRGKQPGARPICRGCFSGLMLTGRPAQGGAKGKVPKSLSESREDSRESG